MRSRRDQSTYKPNIILRNTYLHTDAMSALSDIRPLQNIPADTATAVSDYIPQDMLCLSQLTNQVTLVDHDVLDTSDCMLL